MTTISRALILAAALVGAASCHSTSAPLKSTCKTDGECGTGRLCIDMQCTDGPGATTGDGGVDAGGRQTWYFQETVARDLDILFVIDDARGITPLQAKLLTNFPTFMQVLQNLPMGLPNLHIGVVSTSMGVGQFAPGNCPQGGDRGALQSAPHGTCTSSGLDAGQTFISNVNGTPNYSGAIEDVFSCIAALGAEGCAFAAPLEAAARALGADGAPAPAENQGFLRTDATLAIVVLTNRDDCSVPADSDLGDPSSQLVSDPLGPLTTFRCNEYGHLCNGAAPPRTRAADLQGCAPAEGSGKLTPVADFVRQIKSVKADPSKILVSVIAGLPTPYHVSLVPPALAQDPSMWPVVDHSCLENNAEFADPGVRLAAFVAAFGPSGLYLTICAPSFAPALQTVAESVGKALGPTCIEGRVADAALDQIGLQPDCQVSDLVADGFGGHASQPIPACAANGNTPPCWQIVDGSGGICPNAKLLQINRSPGNLPADLLTRASCTMCTPGVNDPHCNY